MTSMTTCGELGSAVTENLVDERYRLLSLMHRTGTSETWRAHDARLDREVVIELIPAPDAAGTAQLQDVLDRKAAQRVPVYDAGSHTWCDRPCTFVVTTLPPDPKPTAYRPRHSSRDLAGTASVTLPGYSDGRDEQPLTIGDWQPPRRTRRVPRSRRGLRFGVVTAPDA
jgi:hypothetical protein